MSVNKKEPDRQAFAEIQALDPDEISRFLLRRRREKSAERLEIHLDSFLKEILVKANEFVPSESGSILLDDPRVKMGSVEINRLTFIAVFGRRSKALLGTSIPAGRGIAGHVYRAGRPYIAEDVSTDAHFFPLVDEQSGYETRSVIAVPVIVGESICGVLELLNRLGGRAYSGEDLALLETFAGYISSSIQNALDVMRVRELARRDDLTGLFNDRFLHVRLGEEIDRAEHNDSDLSVIFLDLDYFKRVNDRRGHLVGSQVLREVGELLQRVAPPGSVTARYGGDEFVVVLPGYEVKQALQVAEEIRTTVADAVYLDDGVAGIEEAETLQGAVTCSLGVASLLQHVPPVGSARQRQNTLLRLADAAMYRAKAEGKNRVVASSPEM
jgi:diguanylate cyclase (GGDEF)-like protein